MSGMTAVLVIVVFVSCLYRANRFVDASIGGRAITGIYMCYARIRDSQHSDVAEAQPAGCSGSERTDIFRRQCCCPEIRCLQSCYDRYDVFIYS